MVPVIVRHRRPNPGCRRLRDFALSPLERSVPIYYFHLSDGTDLIVDEEGRELGGDDAVAAAALQEARAILSADASEGRIMLNQRIDVTDDRGCLLYRLPFQDAVHFTPPDLGQIGAGISDAG
jgi:hypothetical protein